MFYVILNNAAYYVQGWLDGKQDILGNLNIVYTYHEHIGSAGTTANGCYTTPVFHTHADACYSYCSGKLVFDRQAESPQGTPEGHYHCSICNKGFYYGSPYHTGSAAGLTCNDKKLTCSKTTSTIDKYSLGCDKTEDTIESATIIY